MKKSKVFLALAVVLLVILCCSAAGCFGNTVSDKKTNPTVTPTQNPYANDPIVGKWKTVNFDGGHTEVINTYKSDGTYSSLYLFEDGTQAKGDEVHRWYNIGNNSYGIDEPNGIGGGFILNPEEKTLTQYYWMEPDYFNKEKEYRTFIFKRLN